MTAKSELDCSSKNISFILGGKRSLHSGSSIESNSKSTGGLTKQMNLFLRTKSDSGKKLSDEVNFISLTKKLHRFNVGIVVEA